MTSINQVLINQSLDHFKSEVLSHWRHTSLAAGQIKAAVIISVSDGYQRARVKSVWLTRSNDLVQKDSLESVTNLEQASNLEQKPNEFWHKVIESVEKMAKKFEHPITDIRIEWVSSESRTTWGDFKDGLKQFKRNYYRSGIAFEGVREPWLLITEMELNANACLYQGNKVVHAGVNEKNLKLYFKARHGSSQMPEYTDELALIVFNTSGVYIDLNRLQCHRLETAPRNKGRREMMPLSFDTLFPIITQSTEYLSKQVQPSGRYIYGYFPCFNRQIATYNNLRHASSTYALLEGYEANQHYLAQICDTGNDPLYHNDKALQQTERSIKNALSYLVDDLIRHYANNIAYVIEQNGEIKLGANAVAILAIVKYTQVFKDNKYLSLAEKLATGIVAMQKDNGQFVHVLNAKDLSVKQENRIIYYDGEAAFALMRLYGVTQDERWLNCVIKAFDYFIEARHDSAHDHWLSYCSNELVKYLPERKYFEFAVNNIKGYTNFIKNRITTFPTLLELSMAFHKMLLTLDDYPQFYDVLEEFDIQDFYQALHARANYLMNGYFFPEVAMYFKAPNTIKHGFFIRHHAFRVRIDDVEHYLSGLVAYCEFIKHSVYPKVATTSYRAPIVLGNHYGHVLTAQNLIAATSGRWAVAPQADWTATGMCIWSPSFNSGDMVVARGKTMSAGYLPKVAIRSLVQKGASCILTDEPDQYLEMGIPVLEVSNIRQAIISIGQFSRQAFNGQVIGVTGSAGKTTTVSMLKHVLEVFGGAGQSEASANLPVGIAWNMASLDQSVPYWIIEMAIGEMSTNSNIVRPDVALITNIAPAHLEYHHSLDNIAIKKARIFDAMSPGSVAIVYRDIEQFSIIQKLAKRQGLHLITYGEHHDADIQLLSYLDNHSSIQVLGKKYELSLRASGKHMILNSMAIIAVLNYYGLSIEQGIRQLESFEAIAGRGKVISTTCAGKPITLYDDAYNANPLSMRVALETFHELKVPVHQKVLIIGDMLELGHDSVGYHLELATMINQIEVRVVVLVGQQVKPLVDVLAPKFQQVLYFEDVEALTSHLDQIIVNNDSVLIKASHGIGLNKAFL